jgi:hypothetical protein
LITNFAAFDFAAFDFAAFDFAAFDSAQAPRKSTEKKVLKIRFDE